MSPSNLGSVLFIGVEGSVYIPSKTYLLHRRLQGILHVVPCVNACMCICVRVGGVGVYLLLYTQSHLFSPEALVSAQLSGCPPGHSRYCCTPT